MTQLNHSNDGSTMRVDAGHDQLMLTDTEDSDEIDAVFGALADSDARAILRAADGTQRSALQFADCCELPVSTAYRKVDLLAAAGLLEEHVEVDTGGNHTAVYELAVEKIDFSPAEGTVSLTGV